MQSRTWNLDQKKHTHQHTCTSKRGGCCGDRRGSTSRHPSPSCPSSRCPMREPASWLVPAVISCRAPAHQIRISFLFGRALRRSTHPQRGSSRRRPRRRRFQDFPRDRLPSGSYMWRSVCLVRSLCGLSAAPRGGRGSKRPARRLREHLAQHVISPRNAACESGRSPVPVLRLLACVASRQP